MCTCALPQGLEVDEEAVGGVVRHLKREAREAPAAVQAMLLDCSVELSTKLPLYALLLGERPARPASVGHAVGGGVGASAGHTN